MRDLLTALALILVIEGIVYALLPEMMRRLAAHTMATPAQTLRIGAVAYRRDVKSVRGRRRGRRRRGRRRLGSRARQAVKEAKEAAVGAEHERGVVAVERRPVGLQRAVEGKELPILTERIGIDLDRLRVAVAAHPLTVALRLGEDNGAFALGGGAQAVKIYAD